MKCILYYMTRRDKPGCVHGSSVYIPRIRRDCKRTTIIYIV